MWVLHSVQWCGCPTLPRVTSSLSPPPSPSPLLAFYCTPRLLVASRAPVPLLLWCYLFWPGAAFQVSEMERLYGESISKLLARVELLETRGAAAASHGSPAGTGAGSTGSATSRAAGLAAGPGGHAPVRRVQTQPSEAMQTGIRGLGATTAGGGRGAASSAASSGSGLAAAALAAAGLGPGAPRNRAAVNAGSAIAAGSGLSAARLPGGAPMMHSRTPDLPRYPSLSEQRRSVPPGVGVGQAGPPGASALPDLPPPPVLASSDSTPSLSVGAEELGMDLGDARMLLSALISGGRS